MTRQQLRASLVSLLCAAPLAVLLTTAAASAAPPPADSSPADPPSTTLPPGLPPPEADPASSSLVPVPLGCPVPDPAAVVFTGTMIGKDDVTQTVRFRIDQLRAGSAEAWAVNGLIDVRYGPDYRFLATDEQYLIGAGLDSTYGVLSSTVRPPEPTFGGNDVVGVDDLDVECPDLDDPIRTLNVDGTSIDSGVLSQMTEDRRLLLATLAVPAAIVFAVLLALVVLRGLGVLAIRGMFGLGRAAVTPVPDHRAVRLRAHHPRGYVEGPSADVDDDVDVDDDALDDVADDAAATVGH